MIARYTRPEIGRLFTDQHRYETWLAVELAVVAAWAARGEVPADAAERIVQRASFKVARIDELEGTLHHDVLAFTTAVGEHIGADSGYFHKGLTSSDVVDTSQSIVLREAGQLLELGLTGLRNAVGRRALEHKRTPCIGRTHGVHAEPTTFGLRLLVWYDELGRHQERLAAAIDDLSVGKLSGAVGNFAHLPPDLEAEVLASLSLRAAPVSNQVVQRDRHAHFITTLAGIGSTLEKIAVNLRTLQRTEIGEVQEPFSAGQKGSSAMPHKKNPILLERITGLSRVLRGYAVTALENVALWDERDISHSGAERVILPDACIACDYALHKLAWVVENMEVREARMLRNLDATGGLIFSQRVMLALTDAGMSREDAYAAVQENALRSWEDETPLLELLRNDPRVTKHLKGRTLAQLFTLDPYLAHVDALFQRVGLTDTPGMALQSGPPPPRRAAMRTAEANLISAREAKALGSTSSRKLESDARSRPARKSAAKSSQRGGDTAPAQAPSAAKDGPAGESKPRRRRRRAPKKPEA